MSDGLPPPQARHRSSLYRSSGYQLGQEGLVPRRSHSGGPSNLDDYAVATGFDNPASRSASIQTPSIYSEPDAPSVEGSVDTLPGSFAKHRDSRDGFASRTPNSDEYRGSSGVALPSLNYNLPPGERPRQPVDRNHQDHDGLVGHVKHAFTRIAHGGSEPPPLNRRQNSWMDAMYSGRDDKLDNFERTQAINDEVEETYLYDEGQTRGRYPRKPAFLERQASNTSQGTDPRYGRRSYRDRRKKEKHIIKYHAESTHPASTIA